MAWKADCECAETRQLLGSAGLTLLCFCLLVCRAAVFHELHFSDLNMASMSDESGFFLAGVLHYDTVAFHAMKFKISSVGPQLRCRVLIITFAV